MKISWAEEAFQQAADIVENINLGIYIFKLEDPEDDRSLRILSANPATERLTGIPVEAILGRTLDTNFPGLREKVIPQMFVSVIRDQVLMEIEAIEYEDKRISPSIFSVKAFPLPNLRLAVSLENITHRKHTEEALKKSEEKHRQLIEVMNEGFVILNREGIITYANLRLCEMMGYTCPELIGRPTTDFLDRTNTENMQKHVGSRTQGKSIPYEVEWLKKDGSALPTIVSPMPLFNEDGEFSGNVAVLTDISDLKRVEKELIEKNQELEKALKRANEMHEQLPIAEKMASLGQITAGVAHELKNPLGYIQANISPLIRDVKDLLSVLESYESLVQVQNMRQQFSEIDSTLMLLSGEIGNRISIKKDYNDLPDIEFYPGKLNQVFMNILTNAIQAIENKGEIVIRTSMDEHQVFISITDSGKGMPEEVRKRIFEPFFTTKEMGKGAGLGLSICYNIISQQQGTIDVLSEPGKGTEFIITLPRKQSKNHS